MRQLELKQNDKYVKCPRCGNNTKFKAYSAQVGEDCCEVWVECTGYRYEGVWGGTQYDNVMMALDCWNDAINDEKPDSK